MKTALSPVAQLSFNESESILYIKMLGGTLLSLETAKQHGAIIEQLTQNKPYLALVDATQFYAVDDDAIKYAAIPAKLERRIAAAYFNPDLANWFSLEIWRKNGNLAFPVEIFKTETEALAWLKTHAPK